jgi:hypothetical protein
MPSDQPHLEAPEPSEAERLETRMEHGRYVIGCRFAEIAEFEQ